MSVPIVILDACVLYPAPLRDLLMNLVLTGLFKAKWTNMINEEWIRNVLKQRPDLTRRQLERTRDLMNSHAIDSLVDDYENLIPNIILPDPADRHVLAAAIKSQASLIVTYNLKDFPLSSIKQYGIKAIHPDNFVTELFLNSPEKVMARVERLRSGLKNPPLTRVKYLRVLVQQKLEKFTQALLEYNYLTK